MHESQQVVVTLGAVLVINRILFSMSPGTLMTAQAIYSIIGPAEILFAMGNNLQGSKPRKIVHPAALRRVTRRTGPSQGLRMHGRQRVSFAHNPVFRVTGIALGSPVFTSGQAVPVFLFMAFDTRNSARSFHRLMRFILNSAMAVETGKIRSVSRVFETLYVNLKGTLFAPYLVTTNTIVGSVSPDGVDGRATEGQSEANEEANPPKGVI